MALRVRKLARELKRSPAQVLGLLHHLGYTRYKGEQDMVGGAALTKLRAAIREGLQADPVAPIPIPTAKPSPVVESPPETSVMAQLVSGVVPPRSQKPPTSSGRSDRARRKLERDRAAVDTERQRVAEDRRTVDETRSSLEADRRALAERQMAIEEKQARLEAERTALHAAPPESLAGLLGARGLRGFDEQERALAALASARQLGSVLPSLIASDPVRMARILQDKLVLVDTEIGEGFPGLVAVAVSSDRAEVPSPAAIATDLDWIGAQLLLCGLKRVLIVGGEPRWQGVIREAVDDRVSLIFTPHGPRSAEVAEADVSAHDVVVRWPEDVGAAAKAVYRASSCLDIGVPDRSLKSFLDVIRRHLDDL